MNPRIYASRAAKQAEYREAIKSGFDTAHGGVKAYRAALAAGTVTRPTSYSDALGTGDYINRGWFGQPYHSGKSRVKATHIASPKPDAAEYVTACGKFLEDVKVVTDIGGITCAKCLTNYVAYKPEKEKTHFFMGSAVTPFCLKVAGKRAKRGKSYVKAQGEPTCKACLTAITIPEEEKVTPPPAPKRTKKLPETEHFRIETNGGRGGAFAYNIIRKEDGSIVWRGEHRGFGSDSGLDWAKWTLEEKEKEYQQEREYEQEQIEDGEVCDHGVYYHDAEGDIETREPHSKNPDCAKCKAEEKVTPPPSDSLTIDGFTKAQMREVTAVGLPSSGVVIKGNKLIFASSEDYQRIGKMLIEGLDKRTLDLDIRKKVDSRLLQWRDKSPEGVAAKKQLAISNGIIKACIGASCAIEAGDVEMEDKTHDDKGNPLDHPRTLYFWKQAYDDAQWKAKYDAMEKLMADHDQRTEVEAKITPPSDAEAKLDAVKNMAASIYPNLKEETNGQLQHEEWLDRNGTARIGSHPL